MLSVRFTCDYARSLLSGGKSAVDHGPHVMHINV